MVTRVFTVSLPLYVSLSPNTFVSVSSSGSTRLDAWAVDQSANNLQITISGRVSIKIKNIQNPYHYQGGRNWMLKAEDTLGFESSLSNSIHVPSYSPAQSMISIQLTNDTIQQESDATLNF